MAAMGVFHGRRGQDRAADGPQRWAVRRLGEKPGFFCLYWRAWGPSIRSCPGTGADPTCAHRGPMWGTSGGSGFAAAGYGGAGFAVGFAAAFGFAFVPVLFTASDGEFALDPAIAEIKAGGDER